MESLLLASVVLDCAAVAAIAWFVRRAGRHPDAALALHSSTLARLRAELVERMDAAEERLHALERVQRDAGPRADPPRRLHLGVDPAEARLLRDLERPANR